MIEDKKDKYAAQKKYWKKNLKKFSGDFSPQLLEDFKEATIILRGEGKQTEMVKDFMKKTIEEAKLKK